jgi:phosphoribosylamine---glycine ligase
MVKILLIDHSGRGHAFADLFTRTNNAVSVHYAPGCPAITQDRVFSVPSLILRDPGPSDPRPMVEYALREQVDFVFVSNPVAIAEGFVDPFKRAGLRVIGPDKQAARIESSKIYAKGLFQKYGIPSPDYESFSDPQSAKDYVRSIPYQVVVKADGMCGGNGSFVCNVSEDALQAIEQLMVRRMFGEAGARITVERRLYGRELSFFALLDGKSYLKLPMALDYPKSDDGNRGVDSAGMGAICPHPLESNTLVRKIEAKILLPLMRCLEEEDLHYTGIIYLGCILVDEEPMLLEVNARMGDPEAEVVLPRIETDFVAICQAVLTQSLDKHSLCLNNLYCCDVVATQGPTLRPNLAGNYPGWPFGAFGRYYPVSGLEDVDRTQCRVFIGQASVHQGKGLVTDGGRIVHIVGCGDSIDEAVENAYSNISHIRFNGIRYRNDIGRILPWE